MDCCQDTQLSALHPDGQKEKGLRMRRIDTIVIHCTATRADCPLPPSRLDRMHRERGFRCCGYHYYIRTDGTVFPMRPVECEGAHARGYNATSVGIAYEGGLDAGGRPADTRTAAQKDAMCALVRRLVKEFPVRRVVGHRDLSPDADGDGKVEPEEWTKVCPCFEVGDCLQEWFGKRH